MGLELTPLLPGAVDGFCCFVLDWFKLGASSRSITLFAVGEWLPGAVAPMQPLRLWLLVRCPGAELADGAEAVADHCLKARRLKSGAGGRIEFLI